MQLTFTDALREFIVYEGFSPEYGARPLRRAIQRCVEDAVAEALLSGFVAAGDVPAESGRLRSRRGQVFVG